MQDAGVRQEEPTVTVAPTAGKGKRPKLTLHQRINRQIVKADDSDAVLHLVEKHAESLNAINIAMPSLATPRKSNRFAKFETNSRAEIMGGKIAITAASMVEDMDNHKANSS